MKNRKNFSNYLKNVFLSSLFLFTALSYSYEVNSLEVSSSFRELTKKILVKNPNYLKIEIFDISDNIFKNFIESNSKKQISENFAIYYFEKFSINKEFRPFCLVYYDSKSNFLNDYISKQNFSKDETFTYLFSHEIGHCLFFNKNILFDERKNELVADMFSLFYIYFFEKNNVLIDKIINNNKLLAVDNIHNNYIELNRFSNFLKTKSEINNIEEFFDIINSFFNN